MSGITLENGLVSYYGNPAGYTEKGSAVVDSIFKNDELTTWLTSRSLIPKWTDGVMEQLLAGGRMKGGETMTPLKNVRIWQLKPESDVRMKFVSLDERVMNFGQPRMEDYRLAYNGQLHTNDLEEIYVRCNMDHPPGYDGHSLSMSDVVELYDADGSEYHYCDRLGFKQTEFASDEQAEEMAQAMNQTF